MSTFSQIVDEAIQETKRPDLLVEATAYLNQTIREVHFRPDINAPLSYRDNFRETQIVSTVEGGMSWDIPNPATFQRMAGVRYPDIWNRDGNQWAKEKVPSRGLQPEDMFYYRVGSTFVFSNFGAVGSRIDLGWFEFPNRLKYYPIAQRPAMYDDELGWLFAAAIVSPEQRALARLRTSNWLTLRWHDVLLEGLRAKIYKRVSDEARQRVSYSLFQQLRQGLWISETVELGG